MQKLLPILLVLIIGGASGFGFGYLTRGNHEDARTRERPLVGETVTEAPTQVTEDPGTPAPPPADLAAWLADPGAEGADTGNGRFEGSVRAASGAPIAGVLIRLRPYGHPEGQEGLRPDEVDLESYVHSQVRYYHWSRTHHRETRTDPDGNFLFDDLPARWYRIDAELAGYQIERTAGNSTRFKPNHTFGFVAKRVVRVPVDVRFEDGREVAEGRIHYDGKSGRGNLRWTSHDGTIALPPGTYELTAFHDLEYRSAARTVKIGATATGDIVTLTVKTRNGIHGTVFCPDNEILGRAYIRHMRVEEGATVDARELAKSDQQSVAAGSPGFFSLMDLEPGTYAVGAGRSSNHMDIVTTVEVTTGIEEITLTIPSPDPAHAIVLWLRDAAGDVIRNARIHLIHVSPDDQEWLSVRQAVRRDGSLYLLPREQDLATLRDPGEGSITVSVTHSGMEKRVELDGFPAELTIEFEEPAELTITVVGYDRREHGGRMSVSVRSVVEPPPGADPGVVMAMAEMRYSGSQEAKLDDDGMARISSMQPGAYDILLKIKSGDHGSSTIAVQRIQIVSGPNDRQIAVPPLYTFTVVMEGETHDASLYLSSSGTDGFGGASFGEEVDESGRATFSDVPAGTYQLNGWGVGIPEGAMTVTVPGPAEFIFAPAPVDALAVQMYGDEGLLHELGLEDGDLIIGIDDDEFENMEQMQLLFASVMAKDKARFIVDRDGTRIEVEFVPRDLMGNPDLGGDLEPASRE